MTDRRAGEPGKAGPDAALVIVAAIAVLAGARWLARLGRPTLAAIAAGVIVVLFVVWAVRPRRQLPRHRVRVMRLRARLRLHPGPGHATVFELWLRWGRLAAARRARRSRPSLFRRERLLRPSLTSVLVARAHYGHALRVPVEEHVLYIAPPRAGKTGTLAEIIARHPGPAVVTSTRGDLYELTAAARASCGPVYVFNPQRLAAAPSTMRWDVLDGCTDPATAIRRAQPVSAMAAFKGEGEDFWAAATELWLQTLLHVAALRRATMDLVHYWALSRSPGEFLRALLGAGGEAERWGTLIRDQMTSTATKTTDTIRYMVAANLAFMLDPVLREAVTPGPGAFSPADFVRDGGTLYLIAESRTDRPAPVAGVFAALVTEIYHQAALAAAHMPGGRLDPPMQWALDEVTQTCPLPLPSLLADAGGRGVQIMPVVHGAAQLRTRWGRDGARAILDTCGTKVFLPGLSDPETLEMASKLSGTMAARERGHEHESRHPVMTEDMIRQLPVRRDGTGYAFILRNGLSPVIGRPPVIWHPAAGHRAGPGLSGPGPRRSCLAGRSPARGPRPRHRSPGPARAGLGRDRRPAMTGPRPGGPDEGVVAAVLKLTDLAARVERVEQSAAQRIEELAASCAEALAQVASLREEAGSLGGRADGIEHKLAEVSALLARMSAQIDDLTATPESDDQPGAAYRVNPGPPWWNLGDDRCADATERLRDWVDEVYRPVFGYLGIMLPGCWDRHPLCLACLDVLHEAWCLLYLPPRDPKMVFAQLDWLTRPLLQAAEVMAAETRPCRERGHGEPGEPAQPAVPAWLNGRR